MGFYILFVALGCLYYQHLAFKGIIDALTVKGISHGSKSYTIIVLHANAQP